MHAGLDLAVFNGTGEENKMEKPMGSKTDRAIACQLLSQEKRLDFGKNNLVIDYY